MDEDTRLHPGGAWPERQAESTAPATAGLLGALPEGWVMLGRCRTGTAGPAMFPTGCYALAHAGTGVALVDVAPDATPNAEARLRRALGAVDFWSAFPGVLPVWHGRIELAAWRSLPGIMAEGFAELPPLTVPGKGAWIAAARAALAEDPAWDVPGAVPRGRRPAPPLAMLEPEAEAPRALASRRMPRGRLALLAGFAATFVLGLGIGGILLSSGEPVAPVQAVAAPPSAVAEATPAATPAPPPVVMAAAAEPAPSPPPAIVEAPSPVAAEPAAPEPPEPAPDPRKATAGANATPTPVASMIPVALPLPPKAPAAIKPPVQKAAAKAPDRIDRACTRAQFRFQQGITLTATEAAYLRSGCATRR